MHTQTSFHPHSNSYRRRPPPLSACPTGFYRDQSRSWVSPFTGQKFSAPSKRTIRNRGDVQLQSGDVLIQCNNRESLIMPNEDIVAISGNGDFIVDLNPCEKDDKRVRIVRKGDMTIVTFSSDDRRVFFHPNVPYVFRFEGTCISHNMGMIRVSYSNDDEVLFDVDGIRSISRHNKVKDIRSQQKEL